MVDEKKHLWVLGALWLLLYLLGNNLLTVTEPVECNYAETAREMLIYNDYFFPRILGNFWFDNYDIDTVVAELHFTGTASREDPSLEDAAPELIVYPGTQTGSHTYIAANDSWEDRILRYIETISQNRIQIDENRVVHAAE